MSWFLLISYRTHLYAQKLFCVQRRMSTDANEHRSRTRSPSDVTYDVIYDAVDVDGGGSVNETLGGYVLAEWQRETLGGLDDAYERDCLIQSWTNSSFSRESRCHAVVRCDHSGTTRKQT